MAGVAEIEETFWWIGSPKRVGCLFAGKLAKESYRESWETVVVHGQDGVSLYMDAIAPSQSADGTMLIFPDRQGPEGVVQVVNMLLDHELWTGAVVDALCPHAPPDALPLGLKVGLPWVGEGAAAEVLGLADIDTMPPTRRAPYVAVAFRNGPQVTPRGEGQRADINLCDIPMRMKQPDFENMMKLTAPVRTEALGGYPVDAAKARLTFMVPSKFRDDLELSQ